MTKLILIHENRLNKLVDKLVGKLVDKHINLIETLNIYILLFSNITFMLSLLFNLSLVTREIERVLTKT